jgi:hypothetical protein
MLLTLARRLIIESILPEPIVMLPHNPYIPDALLLALPIIRIVSCLKRQFGDRVHHWSRGGSADVPVGQTQPVLNNGVNIGTLVVLWVVLEGGLVLGCHLELLIYWVA